MLTLCIRYTLNPNKVAAFKTYVDAELDAIRRSGGTIVGYFFPTDFAGPTGEAYGLIDFTSLAEYERYRHVLATDPHHERNVVELERSGAIVSTNRSFLERAGDR